MALAWTLLWLTIASMANGATTGIREQAVFQFKHHNNKEMYETLLTIHKKCPRITSVYTLSETSVEGRPLMVIVFSLHPTLHKPSKILLRIKIIYTLII